MKKYIHWATMWQILTTEMHTNVSAYNGLRMKNPNMALSATMGEYLISAC